MKGESEGFVTAVNPTGGLIYSTFLGGTAEDKPYAIAVDGAGNAHVGGWTLSRTFPTTPGAFQTTGMGWGESFLSKIKPDGSAFAFSTYVSGTDYDQISGLSVDPSGDIYAVGYAGSGFPMVSAVQGKHGGGFLDAHIARLTADGSELLFSTYLGGSGRDEGIAIAADSEGSVYVTGRTESTNFPTLGPYQAAHAADGNLGDAFVARIDTNPPVVPGTSLGPSADLGWTRWIKVDKDGDDLPGQNDNVIKVLREGRRLLFESAQWPGSPEGSTIELSNPHPVGGFYQTATRCLAYDTKYWTLTATIDGYDRDLRPLSVQVTETKEQQGTTTVVKTGSASLSDSNSDGVLDTITVRWPGQAAVNINLVTIDVNGDQKGDFLTIPWTLSQWIGVNLQNTVPDPRVFVPIGDTNGDGIPDAPAFDFDNDGRPDLDLPVAPQVAGPVVPPSTEAHRLNFAQFADGGGLFSQIMLFNLDSTSPASATVTTRDDAGELLPVDLNGEQSNGSLGITVPAGGLMLLRTDGAGPVVAGSVTVTSNRVLAGVVLFGGPFGVAGVGSSFPQVEGLAAPMENNVALEVTTGIAVMNLEAEAATLALELCNSNNTQLAAATWPLAGNGHTARFVNEFAWTPAVDFTDFKGILRVRSNRRIAGTVLQQRSKQSELATMPVLDNWKDQPQSARLAQSGSKNNRLYFSQFADGGGLFSQIMLFNLNFEDTANATLNLRKSTGGPLAVDLNGHEVTGTTDVTVPPGGLAILKTDGQGAVAVGSVVVSSNQPLAGVILFGGGFGVAGVGSSAELFGGFVAPMECSPGEGTNTGVAIMNLEATETTVDLELLGQSSQVLATATVRVPGGGHLALYVNEFQWNPAVDLSNFKGLLRARSGGRIAALALQTRQSATSQFATIPVAPRID